MCKCEAATESSDAGEPETEIEVTHAMIEAGADVVCANWVDLREPESSKIYSRVAEDVYREMRRVLFAEKRR